MQKGLINSDDFKKNIVSAIFTAILAALIAVPLAMTLAKNRFTQVGAHDNQPAQTHSVVADASSGLGSCTSPSDGGSNGSAVLGASTTGNAGDEGDILGDQDSTKTVYINRTTTHNTTTTNHTSTSNQGVGGNGILNPGTYVNDVVDVNDTVDINNNTLNTNILNDNEVLNDNNVFSKNILTDTFDTAVSLL